MNDWIDLTILIDETLTSYPGDKPFILEDEKMFNKDGYNLKRINTNMHVGTHLDALKHVKNISEGIENIDINTLIGKALVIRPKVINNLIQTSDIKKQFFDGFNILILDLGWSKYLNSFKYYQQPKFNNDITEFILEKKIKVLGFDLPSPEYQNEKDLAMHKDLLNHNILIIENLTNLEKLNKIVEFIALPLKIKGLDGSLLRSIARNV